MKNRRLLGNIILIVTAAIWGTAFAFQRMGMDRIQPITFNAARMVLGTAVVSPLAFFVKRDIDVEKAEYDRNTLKGGLLCGFFLAVASILQQIGLVYTSAGKTGFITAMYMLLVPVFSLILFGKKSPFLVWFAVAMGLVGMYLLCMTEGFSLGRGDPFVMGCAVCYSFHIIFCGRYAEHGNPIGISAIQFAVAAVISTAVAFIAEQPTWDKIVDAAIPILYCGIVSGGIGFTLQVVAQKFTEPSVASILMSLESVFSVIAGTFILKERMSLREALGCVVMFAAVVLVQLPKESKGGNSDT